MKLDVPFYIQTSETNCGPTALRMILSYFDKDPEIEILEEKTNIKKGKVIQTIQIAIAAALLGYKTDFYSIRLGFNEENLKLDFYKKYQDMEFINQTKEIVEKARKLGVRLYEKSISLEEILEQVTERSIPIVLLDWNTVMKRKDYQGHFVPIVGYDEENIYVHDHGTKNPKKFLAIKKQLFEKARKAKGTDEDLVVVYRK